MSREFVRDRVPHIVCFVSLLSHALKTGAYSAVPRKLCYKKVLNESYWHCKFWKLSYSVEGVANFSCHCPPVIVFGVYELLNVCIGGDERDGYEVSSPKIVLS